MNNAKQQQLKDENVDFGFQKVKADEKKPLVRNVFDSVATRYDLMNDLMSGGVHRLWKDKFVRMVNPKADEAILDVAGGTGDIAFRMARTTRQKAAITVYDINAEMLKVGHNRSIDKGILKGIDWVCGDAESLSIPDQTIDAYTIAFGLRNVTDIDLALREAFRVLKPGSRFYCLEFSHLSNPILQKAYDLYSFNILPQIGGVVTKDKKSYQYLVESIRKFPRQEHLKTKMQEAGFENVKYTNLNHGIVAIHSGWRL